MKILYINLLLFQPDCLTYFIYFYYYIIKFTKLLTNIVPKIVILNFIIKFLKIIFMAFAIFIFCNCLYFFSKKYIYFARYGFVQGHLCKR
jgi:hypothetical protein